MEKDEAYYLSLDKRTNEYKNWKAKQEQAPKGVGDIIAKVTKATGIERAVKFLAGEDCGCDERKEKLNRMFPIEKPNCLMEDEYNFLSEFFTHPLTRSIPQGEWERFVNVYNRVFNQRKQACYTCSSENLKGIYQPLKRYYDTYNR